MTDIRSKVIDLALKKWVEKSRCGTTIVATGMGKTTIALKAILTLPLNSRIIILFEQTDRENVFKEEMIIFCNNNNYEKNTFLNYKIEYATYQKAYRFTNNMYDLVIADEIHDSLSPQYCKFYFNNFYDYILGLTAHVENIKYEDDSSKLDLLNAIAPVCYEYSPITNNEKPLRDLEFHIVYINLSEKKDLLINNKFLVSEKSHYEFIDNKLLKLKYDSYLYRKWLREKNELLYSLPSKIDYCRELILQLNTPSIIFGNSIDTLEQITTNTVSSRKSKEENDRIKENFNTGIIKNIASFKKLKQGINLSNLDNVIIVGYYSSVKDLLQRIGRLRVDGNKIGKVFIFVTLKTTEFKWFTSMMDFINNNDKIKKFHYVGFNDFMTKKEKWK